MHVELSQYKNRHGIGNKLARGMWALVYALCFRPSPRPCHSWRIFLLRSFGACIGRGCHVHSSCRIWAPWKLKMGDHSWLGPDVECYNVDCITLGSNVTVSQYAHLCTASHDISVPSFELITAPIRVRDGAWVAACAFVHPGVSIGEGAVVGACAVVTKDVDPWTVVAGNPARFIKKRVMREERPATADS